MALPLRLRIRNAMARGFTRTVMGMVRLLPAGTSLAIGRGLGLFLWNISPGWRSTADRNIQLFYHGISPHPSEDRAWRRRVARQSAINLACHAIEFMIMGVKPAAQVMGMLVGEDGMVWLRERYAEARAQGRGLIIISMHYGNWELCGAYLAQTVGVLHAVGKEQRDPFFTRLAFPWRERFGIRNITAGEKMSSAILRPLSQGEILGLISDQNGGRRGHFAPFGARRETAYLASNVAGGAALALRTGAPAILCYTRRISPGKLRCVAGPQVDFSGIEGYEPGTGRYSDAALIEAIARINVEIAKVIEADPTQWLWGHRRWKTRPPGDPPLYDH